MTVVRVLLHLVAVVRMNHEEGIPVSLLLESVPELLEEPVCVPDGVVVRIDDRRVPLAD
jgi:hypothetical protein